MERQSRGWGFESPVQPINFRMLTDFVLISFIKPEERKTLKSNLMLYGLEMQLCSLSNTLT